MARKGQDAGVPRLYAQVTVRLDPETYELAQQAARRAGVSLNAYLARVIRAAAERDQSQEPAGPGAPPAAPPPAVTMSPAGPAPRR